MKMIKEIMAVTLVGAMLLPLAGCARKIERMRAKDFKTGIETVFDDDEYYSYGDTIAVADDDYVIAFMTADDDDDARDEWEEIVDAFQDMKDDKKFDGRTRIVDRDTYGYILLRGDCNDKDFANGKGYYYGGIFYVEDELIVVVTLKDKDACRENVDTILRALGLPRP